MDEEDVAKLESPAKFCTPWNVDVDGSKNVISVYLNMDGKAP